MYLQYALDSSITRSLLKSNSTEAAEYDKLDVKLQRFPYPPYINDKFVFAIQFWMPFFITLSFIYPAMNITKVIVYEKECRLKVINIKILFKAKMKIPTMVSNSIENFQISFRNS